MLRRLGVRALPLLVGAALQAGTPGASAAAAAPQAPPTAPAAPAALATTAKQGSFHDDFAVLSGSSNRELTLEVCKRLGTTPTKMDITRFSDGEVSCEINESIRGKDVFIVQSCASPVNDSIMELLLTVTAVRRSGGATITAIIPYFGYKFHRKRGLPISTTYESRFMWNAASDVAKMLLVVGVDRVVSVDLQRPGQGHEACFFDGTVPVETISTTDLFVDHFANTLDLSVPVVVVSPATEYVKKAKKFLNKLSKHPKVKAQGTGDTFSHVSYTEMIATEVADPSAAPRKPFVNDDGGYSRLLGGSVAGANVIIVDDVVDAAGLPLLARKLIKEGAAKVFIAATHGVFTENSMQVSRSASQFGQASAHHLHFPLSYPPLLPSLLSLADHRPDASGASRGDGHAGPARRRLVQDQAALGGRARCQHSRGRRAEQPGRLRPHCGH